MIVMSKLTYWVGYYYELDEWILRTEMEGMEGLYLLFVTIGK